MDTFAGIGAADIAPALEARLALADEAVEQALRAAGVGGDGAVRETLRHLDVAARHARAGFGRSAALWAVHPDPAVRAAALEARSRHDGWRSAMFARRDLFAALASLSPETLDPAGRRALELWLATARSSGSHLDDESRAELSSLQARATALAAEIEAAYVADVPVLELTREDLVGVDASLVDSLEPGAVPGTLRLRVEYVTSDAVMGGARRELRERFWRLLRDRTLATNVEPMRELFAVRRRIARLSGYASWADLRTSLGALGSVEAANGLLAELAGPAAHAGRAFIDVAESVLADELAGSSYQPWDLQAAMRAMGLALGVDAESLRPYLPLDGVRDGLYRLAREVFGIRVEERDERLGWHEDVRTLELIDDATGEHVGTCLWDPFFRDGKMAGTNGFMELLEADAPAADGSRPPAVTMLVTMFLRPTDGRPVLLGIDEVDVLFHEFGHVLDFTISSRAAVVPEDGWTGIDWVEGPSFFLGGWAQRPEVLGTFARDPQTGEPVPPESVAALATMLALDDISYLVRYSTLGRIDLLVHGPEEIDLDEAWRVGHEGSAFPDVHGSFRPFVLSMVVGGYDAALYGVVFALAVRDELMGVFEREGWRSAAAGRRYLREMFGPGPYVSPVRRLTTFVGHPPTTTTLVARLERAIDTLSAATRAG